MPESGETVRTFVAVLLSEAAAREAERLLDRLIHIDGARLFNAAVALGVKPADLVRDADSVQICLSKRLGAPDRKTHV